jgi:hypothetical protein
MPRPRPTALEWLCLAGGLFLTLQYAWFLDDAFVFFRYVDNLVFLGRGLVFNEGEYVEGCSSPLWTLLLIGPRALGLNYWLIVRVFGVLSFTLFWWLGVRLRAATVPEGAPVLSFPLLYLSFLYGTTTYFTSGMETPLVQLAAVAFALHAFQPKLVTPRVILALSPLLRHELVLPLAIALAWTWWRERRFPWFTVLLGGVSGIGYLLFRIWYYADLYPNTFHLKNRWQVDWGLAYLHDTCGPYGVYVLAPLLALLGLAAWRRGPGFEMGTRVVLLAMAALVTAYVVKIGGDGRHFRYLAFPFCLAVSAASGVPERFLQAFMPRFPTAAVAGTGVFLIGVFTLMYPTRLLSAHPLSDEIVTSRPGVIQDAEYMRQWPHLLLLGCSPLSSGAETEQLTESEAASLYAVHGEPPPSAPVHLRDEYERYLREVRPVNEPRTHADSVCVRMWRERFNERLVHHDGLTDALLAHARVEPWRPGHYKQPMDGMAGDLLELQSKYGWGRGTYRKAVEAGDAPDWIAAGLDTIELIERKIYNRHDLLENLELAFTRVPKIEPPAVPPEDE